LKKKKKRGRERAERGEKGEERGEKEEEEEEEEGGVALIRLASAPPSPQPLQAPSTCVLRALLQSDMDVGCVCAAAVEIGTVQGHSLPAAALFHGVFAKSGVPA